MLDKIREKILGFINSPKDTPLLAGLSVGIYMLLFYYSKNFSLANSVQQLVFFLGYYIVLPVVVLFAGYKIIGLTRFAKYRSNFLFFAMAGIFAFFLLQIIHIGFSKKIALAAAFVIIALLAFKIARYYKLLIVLLPVLSLFNLYEVGKILAITQAASNEWKQQPDNITQVVFKERPNIYYIQPDGYANFENLRDSLYNFDDSFIRYVLRVNDFKIYNDFRSNYYSTLLSNSSLFAMKHHYTPEYMDPYGAREVIISDNPVLKILKNNKYKTHLFTERPYLIINRPQMGFDYCNFQYSELPYFMDGWDMYRNYFNELVAKIKSNPKEGNFYFIESFNPGHIANSAAHSQGVEGERQNYLKRLEEANMFIAKLLMGITMYDRDAIVIIGADHGGFAGFEHLDHALELTKNKKLARSMFGAHLSIRWNNDRFSEYDANLKSSVNVFRTLFSYLAHDKKYLDHLQDNSSYIRLVKPGGLYQYFDDKGNAVFKEVDEVQD